MFEARLIEKVLEYKVHYDYIKYELSGDLIKINLENREGLYGIIEKNYHLFIILKLSRFN